MSKNWKTLLLILLLITCTVWLAVLSVNTNKLRIIACNVGQGDGFLITYKSTQIVIDGGPNNRIVNCISNNIPFWDREIELVVLTHPQKDHYTGLLEIFNIYQVSTFLANDLDASALEYQLLKDRVAGGTTRVVTPGGVGDVRLGLIYLDILAPSKDFLTANLVAKDNESTLVPEEKQSVLGKFTSSLDPNEFSIVALVKFKDFEALFTGDIGPEKSSEVAQILKKMNIGTIDYIKVPHHGSKNGLTGNLLDISRPKVAVISAGKDNSYGHPHKDTLDILSRRNIKILRTDLEGEIVIETDGKNMWVVK